MTDTERLDWIIKNRIDIDAPMLPRYPKWALYDRSGDCLAEHTDLKVAIDQAIEKSKTP